jgi:hypothetical protein
MTCAMSDDENKANQELGQKCIAIWIKASDKMLDLWLSYYRCAYLYISN